MSRGVFVAALLSSFLACAQIAGLSTHVAGDDGGAGATGSVDAGTTGPGADGAAGGSGADGAAGGSDGPSAGTGFDAAGGAAGPDAATGDAPLMSAETGPMCDHPDAAALCPTGLGDCRGTGCNVVLASDAENCGACGHSCRGGQCQNGACLPVIVARDQKFRARRQVAVGRSGVIWGTSDGFIWRLPFDPGAQPVKLADGEGEIEDIVVDDQFAYIKAKGGHCLHDWCLRRIPLVAGQFPSTGLGDIGPNSSYMAIDADALYYESLNSVFRLPLRGGAQPAPQELAVYQGTISVYGIAVDRDYVYWGMTEDIGHVRRIRIDGSQRTPQELASGMKAVPSVAIDDVNVYWTTEADNLVQMRPKDGGGAITTLVRDDIPIITLAVDDVNVYWGGNEGYSHLKKAPKCGGPPSTAAPGNSVFGIVPWMGDVYFNDSVSGLFRVAR